MLAELFRRRGVTVLLYTPKDTGNKGEEFHVSNGAFADLSTVVARSGVLDTSRPDETPMEGRVPAAKFSMHDSGPMTEDECTLIADALDRHIDEGQVSGIILDSVKNYSHFCRIAAKSGGYSVC